MKSNKKQPTLTVLIPAINEDEILEKTIKDCLSFDGFKTEVLVIIDSKVTPTTKKVAKESKARVVDIGKGMGKGAAVRLSIPHIKTDYIVQIDADYQFQPKEIPKVVLPLLNGYDVTLGTRYQKGAKVEKGSVTTIRLIGSFGLSLATTIFAKQRITDVMAGFKGFKTKVLKDLNPKTNHFGYEAELIIRATQKKYKILNVPITYKKRSLGGTNVSSIKHGLLVLQTIISTGLQKD